MQNDNLSAKIQSIFDDAHVPDGSILDVAKRILSSYPEGILTILTTLNDATNINFVKPIVTHMDTHGDVVYKIGVYEPDPRIFIIGSRAHKTTTAAIEFVTSDDDPQYLTFYVDMGDPQGPHAARMLIPYQYIRPTIRVNLDMSSAENKKHLYATITENATPLTGIFESVEDES